MTNPLLLFTEKHQDGDGAGPDVRHPLLRHLIQAEAAGDEDAGGVQGGAGVPEAPADGDQHAAHRSGEGGDRPPQSQTPQGGRRRLGR